MLFRSSTIGAGYNYSLSKRTSTFVSWQRITNKAAAAYGTAGFGGGIQYMPVNAVTTAGEDVTHWMLGLTHSF